MGLLPGSSSKGMASIALMLSPTSSRGAPESVSVTEINFRWEHDALISSAYFGWVRAHTGEDLELYPTSGVKENQVSW